MAQKPTPDRALIAQFQQGDQRAFETLFARHRDQVYTKLYLLVRDHDLAADLFQDVFIKVVDVLRSDKYNEEGKFLPWVLRIAHNAGIDHFRRQKKMPLSRGTEEYDLLGGLEDDNPTREEEIISARILSDVKHLVDQLPEEQREVVVMRMYKEMSFKDIAELTDVSINTALGRMRYALINLRKMMVEQDVSLTMD
ncbi:MAG: sigma-70 family RNA polymerase sigma factor [Flavobacteriales bacterium]|nr:sigma-70 family RNA polymerase sigma factor [Flavobacteriales bacterium]